MLINEMHADETFESIVGSAPLVVLLLTTPDCGVCEALRIKINHWLDERDSLSTTKRLNLIAVHIPLNEHPELAQKGILSAPAVRVYAHGRLFYESAGYFSLDAFLQKVEDLERRMLEE
jgi:thiol-disulfide isomerase/thioredoxin